MDGLLVRVLLVLVGAALGGIGSHIQLSGRLSAVETEVREMHVDLRELRRAVVPRVPTGE